MGLFDKKAVRQEIRAKIAKLSEEEKREISERLCRHIAKMEAIESSRTVALFISLHDEPQTTVLLEKLHDKQVVVPRIEGDEMEFYDISEGLEKGAFGIMEPTATTPIKPSKIDVMIVPGVVFTREGARCGRGKGFYDKYLSQPAFRAATVGICFKEQIADSLPADSHDKRVDAVIFA